jgi:DNA-binding PadR family transcriptional regulator
MYTLISIVLFLLRFYLCGIVLEATLHGYIIVQKLQETSILQGKKPDPSGVYRCLRLMEQRDLVTAAWNVEEPGPAKRLYIATDKGLACLRHWMNTLNFFISHWEESY